MNGNSIVQNVNPASDLAISLGFDEVFGFIIGQTDFDPWYLTSRFHTSSAKAQTLVWSPGDQMLNREEEEQKNAKHTVSAAMSPAQTKGTSRLSSKMHSASMVGMVGIDGNNVRR